MVTVLHNIYISVELCRRFYDVHHCMCFCHSRILLRSHMATASGTGFSLSSVSRFSFFFFFPFFFFWLCYKFQRIIFSLHGMKWFNRKITLHFMGITQILVSFWRVFHCLHSRSNLFCVFYILCVCVSENFSTFFFFFFLRERKREITAEYC